jgi:murein DD-endopeptidase MepM/ murein hydrolase activator NlpD
VDVKSQHVSIAGSTIEVYCSDACLRGVVVLESSVEIVQPVRRGWRGWWLAASVALGGATVVVYAVERRDQEVETDSVASTPMPPPPPPPPAPPPATVSAPEPSPEDKARQEADEALLQELMQDAWIHPLAGPHRRMPANHTGAFGAVRDNAPPPECLQGHCGVDVGYEWGEPVHAVHDGVVDWVNRGPNEENGGVFVKIAHRDSALFSWYFHLAAVPRWVQPGTKVKVGSVIGLLGDTGIKHSAPHLHFAMTVRTSRAARERYIDPEPLLALWPLWLADEHKVSATIAAPGVPVRGPAGIRQKPRIEPAPPASPDRVAGPGSGAPGREPSDPPSEPGSPAPSTAAEPPSAEAATGH